MAAVLAVWLILEEATAKDAKGMRESNRESRIFANESRRFLPLFFAQIREIRGHCIYLTGISVVSVVPSWFNASPPSLAAFGVLGGSAFF